MSKAEEHVKNLKKHFDDLGIYNIEFSVQTEPERKVTERYIIPGITLVHGRMRFECSDVFVIDEPEFMSTSAASMLITLRDKLDRMIEKLRASYGQPKCY